MTEAMEARDARVLAIVAGGFPSLDTAVNIAFPAIDEHFNLQVADLQWIVITYLFTYAALLVPAGRLGDSIGYDRLVFGGAVVSIIGLAGCAVAPSWTVFLTARVVQGAGTALLYAGAPALLTTAARANPAERGRAVSWFQAASMVGLTIGPVIGGPLVEWGGWRSVFLVRVPIAVALAALAVRAWSDRTTPVAGGTQPALNERLSELVRRRGVGRASAVNSLANAAMFPTWLLVPSLLIDEIGVALAVGGFVLAASPAMSSLGSLWIGQRLASRDLDAVARHGLLILAVGLATLAMTGPTGNMAAIVLGMGLVGIGIGVFSVPNMHVVMSALPLERQGVAGGLSVMTRTLGVVFGVLVASALFDAIETDQGFDAGFRLVFALATASALLAAALTTARTQRGDSPHHASS